MISENNYKKEHVIQNPFGKKIFDSGLILHAEESYKVLKKVYHKDIPFISDYYSMMVNTFERMYKGILEEYANNNPKYRLNESVMYTHHLDLLAKTVDKVIPVMSNRNQYRTLLNSLSDISIGYTKSRYSDFYEYEDFASVYRLFEKQRKYLYSNMEKDKPKNNNKSKYREMDDIDFGY